MARLKTVQLEPPVVPLPQRIVDLIDDGNERIDHFQFERRDHPIAAFVPGDFAQVYQALVGICLSHLAPGRRFVEWGAGVGVATCLAAELGFDAVGIEIEPELVELSRQLAADHDIDAEFVAGSFVPVEEVELFDLAGDFNWVRTDGTSAYDLLQLEPDDFDLVYCYPWPGEEELSEELFTLCGATGALLLTFHGQDGLRLQRRM